MTTASLDQVQRWLDNPADLLANLDRLLENQSVETAAELRGLLERVRLQLPTGQDQLAEELARQSTHVAAELSRRLSRNDRTGETDSQVTLAEAVLSLIEKSPLSPSQLAEALEVDVSQISRAGHRLHDQGRLTIEVDPKDGRRRNYAPRVAAPSVERMIERGLRMAKHSDTTSDLLPGRAGDTLDQRTFEATVAAISDDLTSRSYEASLAHLVEIPKESGGTRPAAALTYDDRVAYSALVAQCRSPIERGLGHNEQVLWPRGNELDKRWNDLERFVSTSSDSHVLCVDVQSFYDSIDHDVLADALLSIGCEAEVVKSLSSFLKTVMGRSRGLPQGLNPSDPLATAVLSSVDRALRTSGVRFVRHGDDYRCLASNATEASQIEASIRSALRSVELPANDDKTRTLRVAHYLERRNKVAEAVEQYLTATDLLDRHHRIFGLLAALEADEEIGWGWYHGNLSVSDLLGASLNLEPSDTQALLLLLDAVAADEHYEAQRRPNRSGWDLETFVVRASMSLLASASDDTAAEHFQPWLVARPEYSDALSFYVGAVSPQNPGAVAGLLTRIEKSGMSFSTHWLRLYAALAGVGEGGEFDELATSHASQENREHLLRLKASTFLAENQRPTGSYAEDAVSDAPKALSDDALRLARLLDDDLYTSLVGEASAAAAIVAAA